MKKNPAKPKVRAKRIPNIGAMLESLDKDFFKRTAANSDLTVWDRTWRDNNTGSKRATR